MAGVRDKGSIHEDVSHRVRAGKVLLPSGILHQLLISDDFVLLLVFAPHVVEECKLISQNPDSKEAVLACCCQ